MLSRRLALAAVVVFAVAALAVSLGFWFGRAGQSEPVSAVDRLLLIPQNQLVRQLGLDSIEAEAIRLEKTVYPDGAQLLEMRVESVAQRPDVFVRQALYLESSDWAADLKYRSLWAGTERELRASGGDFKLLARDELFAWGDKSRFAYVQLDAQDRGVLVIAKAQSIVLYLLAIGFAYDDHFGLLQMLADPLDRLEQELSESPTAPGPDP